MKGVHESRSYKSPISKGDTYSIRGREERDRGRRKLLHVKGKEKGWGGVLKGNAGGRIDIIGRISFLQFAGLRIFSEKETFGGQFRAGGGRHCPGWKTDYPSGERKYWNSTLKKKTSLGGGRRKSSAEVGEK